MIKTADLTPRQKKIAVIVGAVLLIYILFGFIGAPFILRSVLENQVARAIDRRITVKTVRVNPLTLSATLRGLTVRENDGAPFVELGEAYVNLQTSSLFKWALVLKTVRLDNPVIDIVRLDDTRFNFSDIGQQGAADAPPAADGSAGGGLAVVAYDTRITGGRINLADRVAGVDHHIDGLDLQVTFFSSRPADVDDYILFALSSRVNAAAFSLTGKARPFRTDRETHAELGIDGLDLPHYLPYLPVPPDLQVKALTIALDGEADFKLDPDGQPDLTTAGTLALKGLQLAHGNGTPLFNQRNLTVDLLPSAVLAGQIRLARVAIEGPEVFIERLPSGALRLPDIGSASADTPGPAPGAGTSGSPPVVTLDQLALTDGVVHYLDKTNSAPFTATINDLALTVDNAGYNSDRTAAYRLTLSTDADESLSLSGTASLTPLKVVGELDVSDIQLARYRPYYQDRFDFKATAGSASFGGNFRYHQDAAHPVATLAGLHLTVDGLDLVQAQDDRPLVSVGQFEVADTTADLNTRELTLGRLALSGTNLACRREADGALNLTNAFTPAGNPDMADPSTSTETPAAPPVPPSPGADADAAPPFVVNLKTVAVSDLNVDVDDRVPSTPEKLKLYGITLDATNLSTAAGSTGQADLSVKIGEEGRLDIGGKLALSPLALDMGVDLKKIDLRPFQPYLSDQVGMVITRGIVDTEGRLTLSMDDTGTPAIDYQGNAGINRFASIDRKHANDFLKWDALRFETLNVGTQPMRLSIKQIALSDFFARVIVDADGSVNLVSMFSSPRENAGADAQPAGDAGKTQKSDGPTIKIDQVTLNRGILDYSDRLIRPNFNARFHDLGGRISGLESMAEKRADVLLEGMWSNHAPVKISGQINPLIEDPFVDLDMNISDIELSPFSPYSGKYIGYILEKGKLTFNVAYRMENRRLEGKNSIYINQLTLGKTVDSPDAVKLPVKLAIALLKDRDGNITLDLPVSGDLDDPQFKIGSVVLTVLRNLIVKIVTSPFAALGSMVGGGEELRYLEFDGGVSDISAENAAKIDKVADILYDRPGLNLDIQGAAGPQWDSDALRAILLENRLKAVKLERMLAAGQSALPLEEISLDETERAGIIAAAFAESGIPLPLDENGNPVEVTVEEMEKLLRTHTDISRDDYYQLASARALNVKQYLLDSGKVTRERLFIVEPEIGPDGPQGMEHARLVFTLK